MIQSLRKLVLSLDLFIFVLYKCFTKYSWVCIYNDFNILILC